MGALSAVKDLTEYVEENGPFDAVLGFSLGAALLATLLLRNDRSQLRIRSAIFLCGTLPYNCHELEHGNKRYMQADCMTERTKIQIPTVHAWSPQDVDYPGQSEQLIRMCNEENRIEIQYSAGHGVPATGNGLLAIANAIRKIIA
ncbi:serine hydrolase FSH protein [Rutstroemia sp. NJR-2017a BVV2]|nr:serine hydrolase FSH protein [Rutstroemia sp. NJR-2017a BVV2]